MSGKRISRTIRSPTIKSNERGAVMAEYIIVTTLLSVVVLYALLVGDLIEPEGSKTGVTKAVHDRTETFTQRIYQDL